MLCWNVSLGNHVHSSPVDFLLVYSLWVWSTRLFQSSKSSSWLKSLCFFSFQLAALLCSLKAIVNYSRSYSNRKFVACYEPGHFVKTAITTPCSTGHICWWWIATRFNSDSGRSCSQADRTCIVCRSDCLVPATLPSVQILDTIFAKSITGAMKLTGSINELTVDRTPLWVNAS